MQSDQLLSNFLDFHKENPKVWKLFERFTFKAIESGQEHYSSDAVCHHIRWYCDIETKGEGETCKINDNYTCYYARMFHVAHPEHDGFFITRELISAKKPAYKENIKVTVTRPPQNEAELLALLKTLI